jgi:hypothetical protein
MKTKLHDQSWGASRPEEGRGRALARGPEAARAPEPRLAVRLLLGCGGEGGGSRHIRVTVPGADHGDDALFAHEHTQAHPLIGNALAHLPRDSDGARFATPAAQRVRCGPLSP